MTGKRILLVNDDGIDSQGLESLYHEVKKLGEIFVIAPDSEKSGVSHAITVRDEICVEKFYKNGGFFGYAVRGTPVDCVKLGIMEILPQKPELVISGINHGENTGLNTLYSGTVSAAKEAVIYGIPAIAVSMGNWGKGDFGFAAKFTRELALKVLKFGLPEGTLLNVNIPPILESDIQGISITRQGIRRFLEDFKKSREDSNQIHYKLVGKRGEPEEESDTEDSAIHRMKISITPIHYDMTNYNMIEKLKGWDIAL